MGCYGRDALVDPSGYEPIVNTENSNYFYSPLDEIIWCKRFSPLTCFWRRGLFCSRGAALFGSLQRGGWRPARLQFASSAFLPVIGRNRRVEHQLDQSRISTIRLATREYDM